MLTQFAVTNYKGFKHRIEWDLSHPSNYSFNADAVQEGVVKNGIIYGPNGAGKSNFGLAIFDIANHLSHGCAERTRDNGCYPREDEDYAPTNITLVLRTLSSKLAFFHRRCSLQDA